MSTIFGIINKKRLPIDEYLIWKLKSSLPFSLSDKTIYHEGHVLMGHDHQIIHRREKYQKQPLLIDGLLITCDARIDNLNELAQSLNFDLSSDPITDPEIILRAFKKWGASCIEHLDGEFCFVIWNSIDNSIFAGTDQIGFRTFYYYESEDVFAFASKIKIIESVKSEPLEIDKNVFLNYFIKDSHPITYDKSIKILPPAHSLKLNENGKIKIKRYWFLQRFDNYAMPSQNWHSSLVKLIRYKISCQIDSDYPIGILLSGGLDSSFIAAIACQLLKEQKRDLLAFCSVLNENNSSEDRDERYYIEKLAQAFDNLKIYYVTIPEDEGPYSNLDEKFNIVEAPVNMFHYTEAALFKAAQEQNVRTLLTGYGGDMSISSNGNTFILSHLLKFKFLTAAKLFFEKYKRSNESFYSLFKKEFLRRTILFKLLKFLFGKSETYRYYPLNNKILRKLQLRELMENEDDKVWFKKQVNSGEIGLGLQPLRKHASAYNLEFLSPMLSREISELFMQIPKHLFHSYNDKRKFIKDVMKSFVPGEIVSRNDKLPFSPDYNKRIGNINPEFLKDILSDSEIGEAGAIGINYAKLKKLLAHINNVDLKTEWKIKEEIYFIPTVIIARQFNQWLKKKAYVPDL